MQWRRRKPLWPVMVALGLLFMLAVAAPRCWQGYDTRPSESTAAPSLTEPESVPDVDLSLQLDSAQLDSAANLQEPPQAENSLSLSEPVFPSLEAEAIEADEPLPPQSEFGFERLLAMRDTLRMVMDQLPQPSTTEPTIAESSVAAEASPLLVPPVRVSSENDRLAMVPRRHQSRRKDSLERQPQVKITKPKIVKDEAADFAEILLRASQYPNGMPNSEPRLARLPAQVKPAPEAAEPETVAPVESQPSPLQPALLRHRPTALIKTLEDFSVTTPGAVWAQQVLAEVHLLTEQQAGQRSSAAELMTRLESLHTLGLQQTEANDSTTAQHQWRQAVQALGRRLVVWRLLLDPQQPTVINSLAGTDQVPDSLLPALSDIVTLLEQEQNGSNWREYLMLDSIAEATSEGMGPETKGRTNLAQRVLSRMNDQRLTPAQQQFLARPELIELQHALRPWAAGKVNLETLAALIERYETGRQMRYGAAIAQLQQRLRWSDVPRLQALGTHLERHYRGANMRIALSDSLMNRMMPKQEPIVTPVRDRIAGAKVRGRAKTTTQLRVRLLPDEDAWRFGLEAFGKVYTTTRSDTWPARVKNAAKMQYQARKEISIDAQGLHIAPTTAQAKGRHELLDVDSQLDPVPILGFMLRDMARQKNSRSRPRAMQQAKAKVVRQVKQRMDSTTDERLEALEQKFRDKVLAPIGRLTLLAEPLDIHTTSDRAVMQLRLANQGQLAAHTQRPLAPSDSVLSMQMHETVLNNALMGLELDGRRMTVLELFEFFTKRFGSSQAEPPADMPRRAIIEFAARDAAQVQCDGDRLHVILSIAELARGRDKIKNFQVHVHFRPSLHGLDVRLVRDGTLQFSGRRLKTGPRVVLHSIIGKLLAKDQEIQLLNPALTSDPRLAGLMVTQLVIEDGWIGLALGPAHARRTAWRTPQPEILDTPFIR